MVETAGTSLPELASFLSGNAAPPLAGLLLAIAEASIPVAHLIGKGALAGGLGDTMACANADGDTQKTLDLLAHHQFIDGLGGQGVAALVSEEDSDIVHLEQGGAYLLAIDPLDGSSNIDTNVSIGTIFSVRDAVAGRSPQASDFLRPGTEQRAAGFIIYGPQTSMVFTTGSGTHVATLDRERGAFFVVRQSITVPEDSAEFAINASNYRHWHGPVMTYIDDCIEGADGPRGKNFNMRWIASLVANAYRIIVRGGVFLYPADSRKGYERGRLRHLYEANPIALIIEQAGGQATDGINRILDVPPTSLHGRVPFIFGSQDKVARIRRYHLEAEKTADQSPLFGKRGLLR